MIARGPILLARAGAAGALAATALTITGWSTADGAYSGPPPVRKCAAFKVHGAKASQIRARGPSCAKAKSVIRAFFRAGDGSVVQGYECAAVMPVSSGRVLCISGEYTIKWKMVAAS